MQKEITKTVVKFSKIELQDGQPVASPIQEEIMLGNVSLEKAQKEINKNHNGATVFSVEPETVVYEMDVVDFIKHAKVKEEQQTAELPDQA